MKIVLITKHYVKNYGSVLQTYATQELLKKKNDDVVVANYIQRQSMGIRYMETVLNKHTDKGKAKILVLKMILLPTVWRWERVFGSFLKKYINVSGRREYEWDKLKVDLCDADVYCTGSDQVWNIESNREGLPAYCCEFAPEDKRIVSLAASFGRKSISNEEKKLLRKYLKKYELISIREKSGIRILQELGFSGTVVLDPTLIVNPTFWKAFVGHRRVKGKYIVIYQLNSDKAFDKYAVELAKRTGLKLVRICNRYDQMIKAGRPVLIPGVEEWISLFYHAEMVITDSFHGTAFSIIFQKEFINVYPPKFSERLDSLLTMLHLEDRKVKDWEDFTMLDRKIDYGKVKEIIFEERKKSLEFIDRILGIEE